MVIVIAVCMIMRMLILLWCLSLVGGRVMRLGVGRPRANAHRKLEVAQTGARSRQIEPNVLLLGHQHDPVSKRKCAPGR